VFLDDATDEFSDAGNKFGATFIYTKRVVEISQPWKEAAWRCFRRDTVPLSCCLVAMLSSMAVHSSWRLGSWATTRRGANRWVVELVHACVCFWFNGFCFSRVVELVHACNLSCNVRCFLLQGSKS
jgi:hypothetical protein